MSSDFFGQGGYAVRFDWGPAGAAATAANAAVIVDVLSFSTSVCVACERGMAVYPFSWARGGGGAQHFADERGAMLAVGRLEAVTTGGVMCPSLSPAGLLTCERVERLVLPSPNGSTIAAELANTGAVVAIGCLRNAAATARWISDQRVLGHTVAVIAAGERWSDDGSLRPALEDQLGAGAILSALSRSSHADAMSPEARTAAALFDASGHVLTERLHDCVSGRELTARGFGADVVVAGDLNSSTAVTVLSGGRFEAAGWSIIR